MVEPKCREGRDSQTCVRAGCETDKECDAGVGKIMA